MSDIRMRRSRIPVDPISEDTSNSEEDEFNRMALEEEQEYETDEDRPIKGAEPPFPAMDAAKQREADQRKLMENALNDSSDSDHDGFSVQNRQFVPQLDHPELEFSNPSPDDCDVMGEAIAKSLTSYPTSHPMVYPPGSPPAYSSGSDEESKGVPPSISTFQPAAPSRGSNPSAGPARGFNRTAIRRGEEGSGRGGGPAGEGLLRADSMSQMSNLMMGSINLPISQAMQKQAALQSESDEERGEEDEDGKFYPGGAAPKMKKRMMESIDDKVEDRKWFEALNADEKKLIGYFETFQPEEMILDTLYAYIPVDYIPAVGEPDPFIKIPRPDEIDDNTGLAFLDEPATKQSDPVIVDMQMRTTVKDALQKQAEPEMVPMKKLERAENNKGEIDKWIANIKELHRTRPTMSVQYSRGMPDVENLMQEWPENVERALKTLTLPSADLDCDLETYVDLVLNTLDIPVGKSRIESLHLLFSLYLEFKNSQHFKLGERQGSSKPKADRLEL